MKKYVFVTISLQNYAAKCSLCVLCVLPLQFELLLTASKFAINFQSSDPWSSTSFFNFSSWKKKKTNKFVRQIYFAFNVYIVGNWKINIMANVVRRDKEKKGGLLVPEK